MLHNDARKSAHPRGLRCALAEAMLSLFWDDALEGFYDTGLDHESLIVRPRNLQDNAVPCGSSVAIEVLLRLGVLLGEHRYEATALKALRRSPKFTVSFRVSFQLSWK